MKSCKKTFKIGFIVLLFYTLAYMFCRSEMVFNPGDPMYPLSETNSYRGNFVFQYYSRIPTVNKHLYVFFYPIGKLNSFLSERFICWNPTEVGGEYNSWAEKIVADASEGEGI